MSTLKSNDILIEQKNKNYSGECFRKYKWWIFIFISFILTRIIVFFTFWRASADKGGWQNFYGQTDLYYDILISRNFHSYCDGQLPVYFFLASLVQKIINSPWSVYGLQLFCMAIALFVSFKIARLFFSFKVAIISTFILAVEPYFAWYNFLFGSENIFTPIFLGGLYYFFKFIKSSDKKDICLSGLLLGISGLTRGNSIFIVPFLSVVLLLVYLLKSKLEIKGGVFFDYKKLLLILLIFNIISASFLGAWTVRNKFVYGRFRLANMFYNNIYFFNSPVLFSHRDGITYNEAKDRLWRQAEEKFGKTIKNFGDCHEFGREEFNLMLDYYKSEGNKYLKENLFLYTKLHLIKAMPFFIQPGYFEMWRAYTNTANKPDISSAIIKGEFQTIRNFIWPLNLTVFIYIGGIIIWLIFSVSVLAALIYSYFKDRKNFIFFFVSAAVLFYSAVVISPFVQARYRLPVYPLFFISFAYIMANSKNIFKFKLK